MYVYIYIYIHTLSSASINDMLGDMPTEDPVVEVLGLTRLAARRYKLLISDGIQLQAAFVMPRTQAYPDVHNRLLRLIEMMCFCIVERAHIYVKQSFVTCLKGKLLMFLIDGDMIDGPTDAEIEASRAHRAVAAVSVSHLSVLIQYGSLPTFPSTFHLPMLDSRLALWPLASR